MTYENQMKVQLKANVSLLLNYAIMVAFLLASFRPCLQTGMENLVLWCKQENQTRMTRKKGVTPLSFFA